MKLKEAFQSLILLFALAGLTLSAAAQVEGPPSFVDYQGTIYDSTGRPYGSEGPSDNLTSAPENKTMEFRVYDNASGGNLVWAETQTVTVSLGQFAVRLGSGAQITAPTALPHDDLAEAFDGKERYLELTVINPGQTPSPILPRLAFQSSPFAFVAAHAKVADAVNSVGGSSLTGTTNEPVTIAGNVTATNSTFAGGTFGGATFTNGTYTGGTYTGGTYSGGTYTGATFTGNGAGLNNLDASKITTGTLAAGLFPNPFPLTDLNVTGTASVSQLSISGRILTPSVELWATGGRGALFNKGSSVFNSTSAANGELVLAATIGKLHLQTGAGSSAITIDTSNRVGIGTNNPTKAKLEVNGGTVRARLTGQHGIGLSSGYVEGTTSNALENNFLSLFHSQYPLASIYASEAVTGKAFFVFSDERIKDIEGRSDSATDLRSLLGIEITDYRYKDVISKGNGMQKKVVAQQVEKVFPQAVSRQVDTVPDIYRTASCKDGWIALATDLEVGERVKLIDGNDEASIHEVLEVGEGRFRTDFHPEGEKLFVFGREVDDFRIVDYEAIAMLNVSATQQIKKELDVVKAENESLKALIKQLAEKDQAREARLIAIEKRIAPGGESELQTVSVRPGDQ